MKIKKLKKASCEELYSNLKNNLSSVKNNYIEHGSEFIPLSNGMERVESGAYDIDDSFYNHRSGQIILKTDGKGTYDFENAKIIYELFKDMSPMDANDERIWIRLTHDHFHKYIVKRWMTGSRSVKDIRRVITERFFYKGDAQAARVRNGISRLWWIAHLTVNLGEENNEKRWALTKAICESQDFITSILERRLGSYSNVRIGILEFYLENKELFGSSKSKKIQTLLKDINNYGGVSLLSLMEKKEVKELVSELI